MKIIHKIAAIVIQDDKFLVVRKKGKDVWTNLGGHPEEGESEEQALIREIKEEMGCLGIVKKKLGDFEAPAVFDKDSIVRLSTYLVELQGPIVFEDPELEEYRFIGSNYRKEGVKLPFSLEEKVLPYCLQNGLLNW
ncbi:MAG: NUDIX domain-containing protein [Candidatus Paceibacterota bacterium]